ncbi:hypothetical protein PO124_03905 [Bacillus licheniformis]|nr:hypothetical protein [Bacillus licheniformis]
MLCGSLSFLSIFWSGESKMKGAAKSVFLLPINNCSAVYKLVSNKPLKYLLYGTSIQQLVFSGFRYISSFGLRCFKDQAWLGGAFQSFGRAGRCVRRFSCPLSQTGARKAAVPALMLISACFVSSRLD